MVTIIRCRWLQETISLKQPSRLRRGIINSNGNIDQSVRETVIVPYMNEMLQRHHNTKGNEDRCFKKLKHNPSRTLRT